MPDNKRKRGRQDRQLASRLENYEIYYIAHKFNVTPNKVRETVEHVGNSRKAVYGALKMLADG